MSLYLTQEELGVGQEVSPQRVSQATKNDQMAGGLAPAKYADYRQNGQVAGYEVPIDHLKEGAYERIKAFRAQKTNEQRAQGGNSASDAGSDGPQNSAGQGEGLSELGQAVNHNVTPVSANLSAAWAARRLAETINEHPQLATQLIDAGLPLTAMGLAIYATDQKTSNRLAKVLAGGVGLHLVVKLTRHLLDEHPNRWGQPSRADQNGRGSGSVNPADEISDFSDPLIDPRYGLVTGPHTILQNGRSGFV